MRKVDSRPVEIQDLLLPNACFKLFIFTEDCSSPMQLEKVRKTTEELDSVLTELTGSPILEFFDILSLSATTKIKVRYMNLRFSSIISMVAVPKEVMDIKKIWN